MTLKAQMKAYVAATDFDWFRFLSEQPDLDEVNPETSKPIPSSCLPLDDPQLSGRSLSQGVRRDSCGLMPIPVG